MTELIIMFIIILSRPKEQQNGPQARRIKDGIEILKNAGYLTGIKK